MSKTTQLLAINEKDAQVRWKVSEPKTYINWLTAHDNGVWCAVGMQCVNLAFADGAQTYTMSNENAGQIICLGDRIALVSYRRPATLEKELTAGSHAPFDPKAILAQAKGKPLDTLPVTEQTIRLVSASDGKSIAETTVSVQGYPQVQKIADHLCVVGHKQLIVLGNDAHTLWQATLPGRIYNVAGNADLFVAATDAKTGQQYWTRTGLESPRVTVSPNGAVYATIELSKDRYRTGEAERYRVANVEVTKDNVKLNIAPPPYAALVRLDVRTGNTMWGVRNIGDNVLFAGDKLFVVDELSEVNLLAGQIFVGGHRVQCLDPLKGAELWSYVQPGHLFHHELDGNRVFLVTREDQSAAAEHTTSGYHLSLIGAR